MEGSTNIHGTATNLGASLNTDLKSTLSNLVHPTVTNFEEKKEETKLQMDSTMDTKFETNRYLRNNTNEPTNISNSRLADQIGSSRLEIPSINDDYTSTTGAAVKRDQAIS